MISWATLEAYQDIKVIAIILLVTAILIIVGKPYFIGKTLADIGFGSSSKGGAVALMIQRGKEGIINPGQDEVVSHVDVLIIAGNNSDIDKLVEKTDKAEKSEGNSATNRDSESNQ